MSLEIRKKNGDEGYYSANVKQIGDKRNGLEEWRNWEGLESRKI